jgi:CheY-like chemotaxis protein
MGLNLKRILLVDDNAHDVELTLMALAEHRLANQVEVACDGVEALRMLHSQKEAPETLPAVIFLDQKMPKLNGIDVLREIRGDTALKFLPVVMLTSSRDDRDILDSYRLHVNAYIVKPVDFEQFIEAVKQLGFFWGVLNENCPR